MTSYVYVDELLRLEGHYVAPAAAVAAPLELFAEAGHWRSMAVRAVAAHCGVPLLEAADFAPGVDAPPGPTGAGCWGVCVCVWAAAEAVAGRLPAVRAGAVVVGGVDACCELVARRAGGRAALRGGDAAAVAQWREWARVAVALPGAAWLHPVRGLVPENRAATAAAKRDVRGALRTLDAHLARRRWLAAPALSLADVAVAAELRPLFERVLDDNFRRPFPRAVDWFLRVTDALPELRLAALCAKMETAPRETG